MYASASSVGRLVSYFAGVREREGEKELGKDHGLRVLLWVFGCISEPPTAPPLMVVVPKWLLMVHCTASIAVQTFCISSYSILLLYMLVRIGLLILFHIRLIIIFFLKQHRQLRLHWLQLPVFVERPM